MKRVIQSISTLFFTSALILSLSACGGSTPKEAGTTGEAETNAAPALEPSGEPASQAAVTLKVGASPSPHAEILNVVKEKLRERNIELEVQEFTDYIIPNTALDGGELDANFFQHKPYLDDFNAKNGTKLVSAGAIHYEPMGIYSGKSNDLAAIQEGAEISIPNDPTNEARALNLLEAQGLIKLREGAGLEATPADIVENPHSLKFVEIEAAQLPRTLSDVDFGVVNGNYAVEAGIQGQVTASEDKESEGAKQFANVIAVREGEESRGEIKALMEALQSEEVKTFIAEKYGNTVIPIF